MNKPTTALAPRIQVIALALGLFLGQAVLVMAQQREGSLLGMAMALVFVAASSASFVLFMLSLRDRLKQAAMAAEIYGLLGAIGIGLLVSMNASEWIA